MSKKSKNKYTPLASIPIPTEEQDANWDIEPLLDSKHVQATAEQPFTPASFFTSVKRYQSRIEEHHKWIFLGICIGYIIREIATWS